MTILQLRLQVPNTTLSRFVLSAFATPLAHCTFADHYNTRRETFSSHSRSTYIPDLHLRNVIELQFLPISNQISLPNMPRQLLAISAAIRTSHNVYDTLHLHIVGRHIMQVDNVQVPHICNTAPHKRCPKGKLLHVLAHSSRTLHPPSVQLLLLSTLIVQNNMSSHTTPAHIPPSIPSHMQFAKSPTPLPPTSLVNQNIGISIRTLSC